MSILSNAIDGFESQVDYHVELLDIDVKISKMTVKQTKDFSAFQKKNKRGKGKDDNEINIDNLKYILSNFFFQEDGNPLLEEDEEGDELEETIGKMPIKAIKELSEAFADVNSLGDLNEEEVRDLAKKK